MTNGSWWAVALSESVGGTRPLAVVCNGQELVVYRDAAGKLFALEDRCPHRRVPLSLGTVKPGGLQCGYHGWTFDGATGACLEIPNLRADERVPVRYGARAFRVAERDGFVHVWLGEGSPDGELPAVASQPGGREFTGSAIVSISFDDYLGVMLDGPECLLGFDGVRITDFFLGDPRVEGTHLVLDRGAVWKTAMLPPAFVTDHPLIVRTAVPLAGGMIRVDLLDADETQVVSIWIAASANRRGTTGICWRGFRYGNALRAAPLRWRVARAAGRAPFALLDKIDGAAIAALLVAPSRNLAAARAEHAAPMDAAA